MPLRGTRAAEVPLPRAQRRRPQIKAHSRAAAKGPPISTPHTSGPSEVTMPAPIARIMALTVLAGNLVWARPMSSAGAAHRCSIPTAAGREIRRYTPPCARTCLVVGRAGMDHQPVQLRSLAFAVALTAICSCAACSSDSTPKADPGCPREVDSTGYAAPLPGHASSETPDAALQSFLRLNAAAPANPTPSLVEPDFLGTYELPMTGWVHVTGPKSETVFEHRADGDADFSVTIARTSAQEGWAVSSLSRCQ